MTKQKKINWAILSTGSIAERMANALTFVDDANLVAVASRSIEKSQEFANKFGLERAYGSYEELALDSDVDIVYIGTPNVCHYENIILCLNHNKNVICEKPFTLNVDEAREVIELARTKGLFLMEAHKSFYLPGIKKIKELINSGAIGEVVMFEAKFCIKPNFDVKHRMFNLALGGGALLDIGVYPISLAIDLFGAPKEIMSNTTVCETGVDIFNAVILKHENNKTSLLSFGFNAAAPREALILGTEGYIKIHEPFHQAPMLTLKSGAADPVEIDTSFVGNGLNQEAQYANACIKQQKTQSEEFSLEKTLNVLTVTDYIRNLYNIKYPQEN